MNGYWQRLKILVWEDGVVQVSLQEWNGGSWTNPNSEIIGELNRINVVLQDFITDIEDQNAYFAFQM
jgi:hypothetical protein